MIALTPIGHLTLRLGSGNMGIQHAVSRPLVARALDLHGTRARLVDPAHAGVVP